MALIGTLSVPSIPGGSQDRTAHFLRTLYDVEPGAIRAIWLPLAGDTTTTTTEFDGRVWTYDADISARISTQGEGVLVSFNGTDQDADTPDTANLSFGDGTNDSPVSVVFLGNPTDAAAYRIAVSKWDNDGIDDEWWFGFANDGGTLRARFSAASQGDSTAVQVHRVANASLTTAGATALFGASYDGGGGATAMNGVVLYQNASVLASAASNNASYVAMSPTNGVTRLGFAGFGGRWLGSLGFAAVYAANLTADQHSEIKTAVNYHYGLSL